MKIPRIFLSVFLAVPCIFISGHIEAEDSHKPVMAKQKPVVEVKKRNNTKSVKTNQKKVTIKQKPGTAKSAKVTGKSGLAEQNGVQKPLDLSIPYTDVDKNNQLTEQNTAIQDQETNIFASENKKKDAPGATRWQIVDVTRTRG